MKGGSLEITGTEIFLFLIIMFMWLGDIEPHKNAEVKPNCVLESK